MLGPYMALSVASILIGVMWGYVAGLYSRASELTLSLGHAAQLSFKLGGEALVALSLIAVGAALPFYVYYVSRLDTGKLVERGLLSRLHGFLYDRWYINSVYYTVFVDGFSKLIALAGRLDSAIDKAYHAALPGTVSLAASAVRRLHRGRTDYYLALYLASTVAALFLAILEWG
jgi:NADH-quinone oxidoreductase subunit L